MPSQTRRSTPSASARTARCRPRVGDVRDGNIAVPVPPLLPAASFPSTHRLHRLAIVPKASQEYQSRPDQGEMPLTRQIGAIGEHRYPCSPVHRSGKPTGQWEPFAAGQFIDPDRIREHGRDGSQPAHDPPFPGRSVTWHGRYAQRWRRRGTTRVVRQCGRRGCAKSRSRRAAGSPTPLRARQSASPPHSRQGQAPSSGRADWRASGRGSGSMPPVPSRTASITLVATCDAPRQG